MSVMRLGYVHMRVTDLEEARDHYSNTLGMSVVHETVYENRFGFPLRHRHEGTLDVSCIPHLKRPQNMESKLTGSTLHDGRPALAIIFGVQIPEDGDARDGADRLLQYLQLFGEPLG